MEGTKNYSGYNYQFKFSYGYCFGILCISFCTGKDRFSEKILSLKSSDCRTGGRPAAFLLPTSAVVLLWSFQFLGSDFCLSIGFL